MRAWNTARTRHRHGQDQGLDQASTTNHNDINGGRRTLHPPHGSNRGQNGTKSRGQGVSFGKARQDGRGAEKSTSPNAGGVPRSRLISETPQHPDFLAVGNTLGKPAVRLVTTTMY